MTAHPPSHANLGLRRLGLPGGHLGVGAEKATLSLHPRGKSKQPPHVPVLSPEMRSAVIPGVLDGTLMAHCKLRLADGADSLVQRQVPLPHTVDVRQ